MPHAIEDLIPHRPPMCWVDTLVECTDSTATANVRLSQEHFAVANGAVLATALVECAAQTVAAALGHRQRLTSPDSRVRQGMLAAVSNFRIVRRPLSDSVMTVSIREIKRLGPMLLVATSMVCEGQAIASGELSLYV